MSELKTKVKNALDEGRILVLGTQVLLGFELRAVFESSFDKLPVSSQYIRLLGIGLMIAAITILLCLPTYHRIVEKGEDSENLMTMATTYVGLALWPFAVALGTDFYSVVERVWGREGGILAGVASFMVAIFFWNGLELLRRRHDRRKKNQGSLKESRMPVNSDDNRDKATKLSDKVTQVLTETRVVLPGAQALLGFQFSVMMIEGFDHLPPVSKYVHLGSLAAVAISTILLMTPAAYHRLVENGEDTEHFHSFASGILLAAMVPLALGISGDLYVVARKIIGMDTVALVIAVVLFLVIIAAWFALPILQKRQIEHESRRRHVSVHAN